MCQSFTHTSHVITGVTAEGDQTKCTIILNKMTDFSGLNIVENAEDNFSTQHNKMYNKDLVVF